MTVRPFDVCGELPRGITVLEASAGTGKTYANAALAARYVADGVPLAELLEERPRDDEAGDGWDDDDPTRFGRYGRRLWDGLLVCEEVADR